MISLVCIISLPLFQEVWYLSGHELKKKECTIASSKIHMQQVLKSMGYPIEKGVPDVNWEQYAVIILGPLQVREGFYVGLFKLKRRKNKNILEWGWFKEKSQISYSSSTGLGGLSLEANIIVVSVLKQHVRKPVDKCIKW